MNLRQLEYFVAIAEEGQITAAARRLSISQPPLSHELAQLERELGTQLVRRGPRGTSLTDAGRLLYERATRILALAAATEREVSSLGKGLAGTLCVAMDGSTAGLVPQARLAELASLFPAVALEVMGGTTPEVIDLVRGGVAEVGVIRTPFASQGLRCRYAPTEPAVAIVPPSCEVGDELSVSLPELEGVPVACDRRTADVLRRALEGRDLAATVACLTEDARTACSWAASGMAVGIVPRSLLRVCDTGDQFIKVISDRALETRAAVIWRAEGALSPLAERAVALLGDLS